MNDAPTGEGYDGTPATAPHIPVLLGAVLGAVDPKSGGIYVDGTFGAGGYTKAMLDAADCRVVAIDRDPTAIAAGADLVGEYQGRLHLVEGRFSELDEIARKCGFETVDGVVLDIGVSSMQLDRAERGFSFNRDGPLDMRMGGVGPTAADIVNAMEEVDLANLIYRFGEERRSRAVARAIVARRETKPFTRTLDLADIAGRAVGGKPTRIHPATRTFQALRIFVNAELDELARALAAAERILRPGGALAVVTFHSLEDRIAKRFFAERSGRGGGSRHRPEPVAVPPSFTLLARGAATADPDEIAANPRARSARLRAGTRTDARAVPLDLESLGVPAIKTTFTR